MDSGYDDASAVAARVQDGLHRRLVGGRWDRIGQLQFDFLVAHGLQPTHRLLDVGCGALRGGVKFIPYLDPGNYWGVDKNAALLEAGWSAELAADGLIECQPREQLVCLDDFQFANLGAEFDYAIAQSVFTHLSINRIRRCLARLAPCMRPAGRFYATFFEIDAGLDREQEHFHEPRGAISHSDRSFYHYEVRDFAFIVADLPWTMDYIGDWDHPLGQKMLLFTTA